MKKEIYKNTNSNVAINFLIIIPTLNSYKKLKKLVDSLNKQDYRQWRVIFIDGNSSKKHKNYLKAVCENSKRFSLYEETNFCNGIYGAMNKGFPLVRSNEWTLFWGSDDFPFDSGVFSSINILINSYILKDIIPDLFVFKGSYVTEKYKFIKESYFLSKKKDLILNDKSFRHKLFLGNVPPHQATLISPKIVTRNITYNEKYVLAADLDFFLKLSRLKNIKIISCSLPIVKMITGGISSKKHILRTLEVITIYFKSFGIFFLFSLLSRYIRRIKRILL